VGGSFDKNIRHRTWDIPTSDIFQAKDLHKSFKKLFGCADRPTRIKIAERNLPEVTLQKICRQAIHILGMSLLFLCTTGCRLDQRLAAQRSPDGHFEVEIWSGDHSWILPFGLI